MISGAKSWFTNTAYKIKTTIGHGQLFDKNISGNMSKDIDEMENMLNDYLQFAKTQAKENTEKVV